MQGRKKIIYIINLKKRANKKLITRFGKMAGTRMCYCGYMKEKACVPPLPYGCGFGGVANISIGAGVQQNQEALYR